MKQTEPTYRKAAKAARTELAEWLINKGIDPKKAHFETAKILVLCYCRQKREAAKATATFLDKDGTSGVIKHVPVCTCKAENK